MRNSISINIFFVLLVMLVSGCTSDGKRQSLIQDSGTAGMQGTALPHPSFFGIDSKNDPSPRGSSFQELDGADQMSPGDLSASTGHKDPASLDSEQDAEERNSSFDPSDEEYVEILKEEESSNGREISEGLPDDKANGQKAQEFLDTALEFYETSQIFWNKGNLEKSIETLDQAYSYILRVDPEEYPELVQYVEDLRFMISKRILEIYASRYTAVNGFHKEIPLVMNEHVEKEIRLFQGTQRTFFMESYKRSGRYRDEIVRKLLEAGLPEELSWLPLIESGFKVRALSSARALGLWQFIPSTGYKYGLERDSWIDERLDPDKATTAAIAYLKEMHQIFGDWATVLAAYNCGEVRVLKVIREQKINYLDNFWDLYGRLPLETARYVPRFIATLHILKDPARYGFVLGEPDPPLSYETVSIEKQVHLKDVANKMGISSAELVSLNPELRSGITPKTHYHLKVPEGMGMTVLAKLDEIPRYSPPQRTYAYHRVKKGETLSTIARKYGASVSAISQENNIRRKHYIKVGQRLKIPLRGTSRASVASKGKQPTNVKYRVRKGDSLWLIAKKFNMSTAELKRINRLRSSTLSIGQVLKITN